MKVIEQKEVKMGKFSRKERLRVLSYREKGGRGSYRGKRVKRGRRTPEN